MSHALTLSTSIALKEWAVVCDQLLLGKQIVLLRKGGILEQKQGFQIEHENFFLYPNTEHQSREQLKPGFHALLDGYGPPAKQTGIINISGFCRVANIVRTADAHTLRALEPFTCWTQALFDMRINYKPEKPNYVVIVRAFKLTQPITIAYHPDYAGCHSWVPLKQELSATDAIPALSDEVFESKRSELLKILSP